MPFIVIDTCVFLRLDGKYPKTLECILSNQDVIAVSPECQKEYERQACADLLILQSFLADLKDKGKLRLVTKRIVEQNVLEIEKYKQVAYPTHSKDRKWVRLGIAIGAHYIISNDKHLLDLQPNPCNNHVVETIDPYTYTERRCPQILNT